ncbi:MAG: phenylalanine--tRNA ligase subunit alpha [Alphaproteobacteria bacterium]|jgi:phenylalanyl-tRNA synthetase alpha chain|nr:phenylalanine--tRNA ligase subunit alpha [Candidatus Jidaibacter sp.]
MTESILTSFTADLALAVSLESLDQLRIKYTGKNGLLTEELKKISSIPQDQRKEFGRVINVLKSNIESELKLKFDDLSKKAFDEKIASEKIDISAPTRPLQKGVTHPITKVMNDIKHIFALLGFEYIDGIEIEDEWHNFSGLNIPEHHPARQMHDTFYLDNNRLLRTHTSNMQIRHMSGKKPPFKFINIGKVYRSDYDATHTPMFHQLEAVYIDKNVNIAHLKYCIEKFLTMFFDVDQAPIKLRASHFPFTEPSAEVDVQCDRTSKDQIIIGKGTDWIEILGCGMIHPNVLENVGIDPNEYQGFALGAGIERLAMLKYNISDLRKFFTSDARWLKYYGF